MQVEKGTSVAVIGGAAGLKALLEENKKSFAEMLESCRITAGHLIKMAMIAASRQPKLYKCTKLSLIRALMDSAELDLDFSGQLGTGYLIPYWNKDLNSYEATFMAGWRGLRDLALRSPDVLDIEARVVYEKDDFKVEYGMHPVLEHKPYSNADRGPIKAAYMIARFRDAPDKFEWMWADELENIHQRSKSKDSGPWITDEAEMCRKSVTRRGLKWVPLTVEVQEALAKATVQEDAAFGLPEIAQGAETTPEPLQEGRMGFGARAGEKVEQKAPEPLREAKVESIVGAPVEVDKQSAILDQVNPAALYPGIERPFLQRASKRSKFIDAMLVHAFSTSWPEERLQAWLTERTKGKALRELGTEKLEDLAGEISKELENES